MDVEQFRERGKAMIDFVADYIKNISSRNPFPAIDAGYMKALVPDQAPEDPDKWENLFNDIERVVMPGVCHWQHPNFHAYFPAGNSFESTLADILGNSIGAIGFSWASCPASTELEVTVTDWLGKMLQLPDMFLHCSGMSGGGSIQHSACEATFFTLLAARAREISKAKREPPEVDRAVCLSKFVMYCSDQAHISVERAGLLACVTVRTLETDENESLRGDTLQEAIDEDRTRGLLPIYVCATLGTTSTCAFDNVQEIGEICKKEELWLHIDAAYAGSAFICPEYRALLNGVELAESFSLNPHKWMKVYFDCSVMCQSCPKRPLLWKAWVALKPRGSLVQEHWSIPQGRNFRSLKLWFVLRMFGVKGLQEEIRKDVRLALYFETLVKADARFEIFRKPSMGLVCFRLKTNNCENAKLLFAINEDRRIHLVPSSLKGVYFLRFVIGVGCNEQTDVEKAWKVILEVAEHLH